MGRVASIRAGGTGRRRSEVLTDALRPTDDAPLRLAGADHAWLGRASRFHRVAPYVLRRFGDQLDGTPVRVQLVAMRDEALRHHIRALAATRVITERLADAGVGVLVVKGPVLAEHLHAAPDMRPYNDLDVLVRGAALETAVGALASQGWRVLDRNWELLNRVGAGQLHVDGPYGTPIDLHWQLVFREDIRRSFPVRVPELFDRSRSIEAGGVEMRTLDAVDTLLHLCLHAAQSGAHRLIWLKDVERSVKVDRPDWDELVRRAGARRLGLVCALVLSKTQRAIGAAVPDDVLKALAPRKARIAFSAVDKLAPAQKATSRGSPSRMLAKATRGDVLETTREIGGRMASVRSDAWRYLWRPGDRPDATADLMRSLGGHREVRRFFDGVFHEDVPQGIGEGTSERSCGTPSQSG